jgi:hypothetical protein
MDDTHEIEQLRARIAELEAQLSVTPSPPEERPGRVRGSRWWGVSSAVLLVLACVLAPLSVTAVWAKTQVDDTDAYVETVAPLADDPAVQAAVANEVTTAIFTNLDVRALTTEALTTVAQQPDVPPRVADALPALAVPISDGLEGFTKTQVANLLASPQFARLWAEANRIAHTQVVKLLEGNQGGAVSAQGDTVTLNLGPIIEAVKTRLVQRGFGLAANIPSVDRSFVLVQSDSVATAQGVYRLVNTLGFWLPIAALVFFAGGVALARDRRRALLRGALGVVAAMVVLGVALAVMRSIYVSETPADILTAQAAGGVFDTLVRFLRTSMRALAVLGLLVALAAFLAGPSTAAVRTRAGFTGGIGSLRGGAEAGGWRAGPVAAWTYRHRQPLRVAVLTAGGLVLVFWSRPTAWVVVGVALVVVVLLALVEALAVPPAPGPAVEPAEAEPATAAPATAAPATAASAVPRQRPGPVQPRTPLQPTEKE